jgi:hypothetical protein
MKILAIGDIHGDRGLVKKISKKIIKEKVDLVILAGDLTIFEMGYEGLIGELVKTNRDILIIPGNHESNGLIDYLSSIYKIKNLHGSFFKKDNLGFFGAGGADVGPYCFNEEEIFHLLTKGHSEISNFKKKIMVTHMPPKGSSLELEGVGGSEAIQQALKKFNPDILICAHIHESGGLEDYFGKTKIINVSRKEKIFDI